MLWSRSRAMLVSELGQKGFLMVSALGRSCYGTVVPDPWELVAPGWVTQVMVTTSKLSGVSVSFGLCLFPWKMQVAGPVPTCYRARGGPHVCWPWGCSGEGWGCRGLPWLRALSSSSLGFFTSAQGDAPQSKRRWDFRPLSTPMFPRMGRLESAPQEGVGDAVWSFYWPKLGK